ncbi:MAG: HAMP domain-containing histidine kinase [Cyanobacteria bacterium SIG29]|nr:HAMP domain-containing histidine kinase [Cyanobacteria bacterium SIG29]
MKNKYNTLHKYIFDNLSNEYNKETINGLFRSILEPVVSNQKFESCVLVRLLDLNEKEAFIKRLSFSNSKLFSFSDFINPNNIKEDIWGQTEFVIILGQRYSVALLWDYNTGSKESSSSVCLLYNSKFVGEIAKVVLENSLVDFKDLISQYSPDRRENIILNSSINNIASLLSEKNEEILYALAEKDFAINSDDSLKTANIVAEKAKFIAHEIKNNLSIINLYSKIVEKRLSNVSLDDEIRISVDTALKNITSASETISSQINDLRCLSTPYLSDFSIKKLVLNTVLLCEEKAKKAGVDIVVADFNDVMVTSDKVKVESSLTNLIFNAIEACNQGQQVCVDCFVEPKEIRIFVKNNGAKIPNEIKTKIFESDFTTKENGNGLGLAICKNQMQLVSGDINLVHSNDVETLFEIVLKR